jgi:hypothetical protein
LLGGADQNCNKAAAPPVGQPNLVICEEVRLNGATEDYIAGTNLWKRPGQALAAARSANIQFSPPSIEIKADWIQLSSIGYDCNNLPASLTQSVHVETINGNCFALAGMHLTSKLLDKWLWATFEPQNLTNQSQPVLGAWLHRHLRLDSADDARSEHAIDTKAGGHDDRREFGAGMVQLPARRRAD